MPSQSGPSRRDSRREPRLRRVVAICPAYSFAQGKIPSMISGRKGERSLGPSISRDRGRLSHSIWSSKPHSLSLRDKCFNDWGGGRGYDGFVPGEVTKIRNNPFRGYRATYPLHGRRACPEFNFFYQGVGQISPRAGIFFCRPLPKRGHICDIPAPPRNP